MTRIRVCANGELAPDEAMPVPGTEPPVTLFRSNGGYFALDDLCTHGNASLCEGLIEEDTVECPLHMARFCLKTGNPLSPPASRPVAVHKVIVEDATVFVEVQR